MTEIGDLVRYVEEHPNDNEARWRLAKKLYADCEYRQSLEHLQVLRNEWEDRINVLRYLSAAYYRLGRYDDAIRELKRGTASWPDELGLREQLARVLEVAGRRPEAAEAWEEVFRMDPKHPVAESAAKRLREAPAKTPAHDLKLVGSDSGIHLSPGRTCPNCGAQNTYADELCWQCQAPIFSVKSARPAGLGGGESKPLLDPQLARLAAGLATGVLLAAGMYLSLRVLIGQPVAVANPLEGFYLYVLAVPRLATTLTLLIAWPLAIHLGLFILNNNTVSFGGATIAGVASAALIQAATAASPAGLVPGCALAAALALLICVAAFRLRFSQALTLSAFQLAVVVLIAFVTFSGVEWARTKKFINPITEIPALVAYAQRSDAGGQLLERRTTAERLPIDHKFVWESSGSAWLDHYGEYVTFVVSPQDGAQGLEFALIDDRNSTWGSALDISRPWSKEYSILTGKEFRVRVNGPEGAVAELTVSGLLRHRMY